MATYSYGVDQPAVNVPYAPVAVAAAPAMVVAPMVDSSLYYSTERKLTGAAMWLIVLTIFFVILLALVIWALVWASSKPSVGDDPQSIVAFQTVALGQSIPKNVTTVVTFPDNQSIQGGITVDATNTVFKVNTTGFYQLNASLVWQGLLAGDLTNTMWVRVNGVVPDYFTNHAPGAPFTFVSIGGGLSLVAGDTVSVYVFQNSATGVTVGTGSFSLSLQ